MKPHGPVPPGFGRIGGELAVAGIAASEWVRRAGDTPLFLYDPDLVAVRIAALRAAMPAALDLHYAIKANPFVPLLQRMAGAVDGFDVASGGELETLRGIGIAPDRISFAGPGKRDRELHAAIAAGVTLNVESEGEIDRALAIGKAAGRTARLAMRVNPDFDLKGSGMKMGGGAKPFGIDAERVPAAVDLILAGGADWAGLHIYAGSQALDAGAVIALQAATIDLAGSLANAIGRAPPLVNLGGGFGIPYFPGEAPLDVAAVGAALGAALEARDASLSQTRFAIELGRYLVGEAGVYLTRVIDRKVSRGQTFVVVDGGLHHQLAASGNFGTVIRRNYPVANASRFAADAMEEQTVVGCLCTPLDRLADQVLLPRCEVGDLIAIFCAGAYGATASPAAFLGQGPAIEMLARRD